MADAYTNMLKQKNLLASLTNLDPLYGSDNMVEWAPTSGLDATAQEQANTPTQMPKSPKPEIPITSLRISGPMASNKPKESLEQQMESLLQKGMDARTAQLGQYDQAIKEVQNRPQELDLSGLASLADAWGGGSQFAQNYKRPETAADRKAMVQALEQARAKEQGALTDDQINYLKAKMDEKAKASMMAAMSGRQDRFNTREDRQLFDTARKEQGGLIKDAAKFKENSGVVERALQPDADGKVSLGQVNMSLSRFARMMGEAGALSEGDVGRAMQANIETKLAEFARKWGGDPSARIDVTALQPMVDTYNNAKQAFEEAHNSKTKGFTETYFNNPGSPYAGRPWAPKMIEELGTATGGNKQVPPTDPRARLEELRKKKAEAKKQ